MSIMSQKLKIASGANSFFWRQSNIFKKALFIVVASTALSGCLDVAVDADAPRDGSAPNSPSTEASPEPVNPEHSASIKSGSHLYAEKCQSCHGEQGAGTEIGGRSFNSLHSCTSCNSLDRLAMRIELTMPPAGTGECEKDCAIDIARFMMNGYRVTGSPSPKPSTLPTVMPSAEPSIKPTSSPIATSSPIPTPTPTITPTANPNPNPSPKPTEMPIAFDINNGAALYLAQCSGCHGAQGQGVGPDGTSSLEQCDSCGNHDQLADTILKTMPLGRPNECGDTCSKDIAAFMLNDYQRVSGGVNPSPKPSPKPTAIPSVKPSAKPSPAPSVKPSAKPTPTPSVAPSAEPSPTPSPQPIGAPEVSFIAPLMNIELKEGESVFVKAAASDSDGSISSVKLWIDNKFVWDEKNPPYEWGLNNEANRNDPLLTNLAAGEYVLTLTATDDTNRTTTISAKLTVEPRTVASPSPTPSAQPSVEPLPISAGYALYKSKNCVACHKEIAESSKRGASAISIQYAIDNETEMAFLKSRVSPSEVAAIAAALADEEGICRVDTDPGPVVMRRLSNDEYVHTLRDLLGVTVDKEELPRDTNAGNFTNIGSSNVNSVHALVYGRLVAKYSEAINDSSNTVAQRYVNCDIDTGGEACARQVLTNFMPFSFRRSVEDTEIDSYVNQYKAAIELGANNKVALAFAIENILLSPNFNFIVELDTAPTDPTAIHVLSEYELASRLSYFIWASMPDSTLFDLADQGLLSTADTLNEQVDRMLNDDKSKALVDVFFAQWMDLVDFANPGNAQYSHLSSELRAAMVEETKQFFSNQFLQTETDLRDMLSADKTYMNQVLAAHYGVAVASGDGFKEVNLPADRAGLLTQASILTLTSGQAETKPVLRGKWVLDQLLCESPRDAPADVGDLPPSEGSELTLKERLIEHRKNPTCAACHATMDPVGIGLESFDPAGLFRIEYTDGDIVDNSSALPSGQQFNGAQELAAILKTDPRYTQCVTEKFVSYARGALAGPQDMCRVKKITNAATSGAFNVRELMKIIVNDPSFLNRRSADKGK